MSKKALRVRVYAKDDSNREVLVIEKTGVHVDTIPAALELLPVNGYIVCDIVDLSADSAV